MAKATKKQVLGRGLSALLKDPGIDIGGFKPAPAGVLMGSVIDLDMNAIEMNPFQPRTSFNEESLRELASSIKELGVIQPITVRKLGSNKFQIVSGERRYRASKAIGNKIIPAYVRLANDRETLEMALVENIQRQDLDPIEIALSYQRLLEEVDLTQEQLSERVGKNRTTISNHLRLLKLDPIIQTGMRDGFISMGHGRALINVEDQKDQLKIYQKILEEKLSVRDTEEQVRFLRAGKMNESQTSFKKKLPENFNKNRVLLSKFFDTPVSISLTREGRGKIIFSFASQKDYIRLLKLLKGAE